MIKIQKKFKYVPRDEGFDLIDWKKTLLINVGGVLQPVPWTPWTLDLKQDDIIEVKGTPQSCKWMIRRVHRVLENGAVVTYNNGYSSEAEAVTSEFPIDQCRRLQ